MGHSPEDLSEDIALAAAIEALSGGHVRVLAAKLRHRLEARQPRGTVTPIAEARRAKDGRPPN